MLGPSPGCTKSSKPARGHYDITIGPDQRGYYLVPSASDEPVPLLLEFHGLNGNGEMIISEFGLDTSLMGNSVIMAPDGSNQGGDIGWESSNSNPDIDLINALIEKAGEDHCIDRSRIYALGASWGGWMATQLACAVGPKIRAFLSIAGAGPFGGGCVGPVAGMIVHGTIDDVEPIASGISSRDKFRTINGCTGTTLIDSNVEGCRTYEGCIQPLLWCEHPQGHLTPQFVKDALPAWFASLP
jgi:poly(3-hydroxybutyrate) depolymerase